MERQPRDLSGADFDARPLHANVNRIVSEPGFSLSQIVQSSLVTEADVELKVLTPLLTNANFLAIPADSIQGKTYLRPTNLDKRAGKSGGYFPDFSVWELGFAVLIVEAKEPDVPVETGFREACLYARHLNAEYKSGINPCHFVLACNGTQLAYGAWDTSKCRIIEVDSLKIGSNELDSLIRFCHHRVLAAHAARCLSAVRLSRSTQPYMLAGDQALVNSKKAFNSFAAELAPTLRRYFTSTTQNNDPDIYRRAYVGSDDITQYDRVLESLLKDRLTARRALSQELNPTRVGEPKLAKAIDQYRDERPQEGQLQLITGSVGTGKSLFARRYKELGVYDEIRKKLSPEEAEKTRISDLEAWQKDSRRLALGICRHFAGERGDVLVVVMDNTDRLDLPSQLGAFSLSLWFLDQSRTFVILQMRDETYERYKNEKPLDTYKTGVVFHIDPPRFLDVVKRRLELSLEYLAKNSPDTLEYHLSSGMRIRYPNSILGEFLKAIYLNLFERRHNVSRILQALAGRNIREALEMFVSILNSGHLREEAITSTALGAGGIALPEYLVLRILMRTEYRFFNNNSGFVANIFHFDEHWRQPNNFILPEILFWLADNRKRQGEIGLEGYFSVARLADEVQRRGFVREDVHGACSWLARKNLVEPDHMNRTTLTLADSIKITAAGFMHLRVLCERLEYLYGVLAVTPVSDRAASHQLADYVRTENQIGQLNGHQQARAIDVFLAYLKDQYAHLKAAYPDFGAERTGASFVINQIESALRFFRNPSERQTRPNMLDI
jgi:hypothetical protein